MVFFVGVMALAAYFVFTRAVEGGSYVIVPDVTGLPVTRAANVLAEVGLELGAQHQVANDRVPEYHVIVQRPRANQVVRSGRKITLTISEGKQTEPAPVFIGKTLAEAIDELDSTRLLAGSIARVRSDLPPDTVLAQDPEPRHPIRFGGEIHLLVSDGPAVLAMYMPSLVGKSLQEAQSLLSNLNIQVTPMDVQRPGAEYDTVLAQFPDPGTRLSESASVSYEVRLRPTTYLPNAKRPVEVNYVVPNLGREVKLSVFTPRPGGGRELVYPIPGKDYPEGQAPPPFRPLTSITLSLTYEQELTLEFMIDGQLHSSYYYSGDATPIVTTRDLGPTQTAPTTSGGFVQQEELEPVEPGLERPDNRFFRRRSQ